MELCTCQNVQLPLFNTDSPVLRRANSQPIAETVLVIFSVRLVKLQTYVTDLMAATSAQLINPTLSGQLCYCENLVWAQSWLITMAAWQLRFFIHNNSPVHSCPTALYWPYTAAR